MRGTTAWILVVLIGLAACGGGFWFGEHRGGGGGAGGGAGAGEAKDKDESAAATTQEADEVKPVVPVTTAALKSGPIAETVVAYGTVTAEAGDVRAMSVPFEARVARVLVTPGEQVEKGAAIVQIEPSPDALIALQEAKNAVEVGTRDLTQTEQRFKDHLATNIELSQAQQALQSAKLKLDSLTSRGVGENHELKSDFAGIVSKVDVQEGQIVAAGAPLVELAAGNKIEVRLNVEPADAQALKVGTDVQLQPVDHAADAAPIAGKVRIIGQRVDPATRLVEVRVSLPSDAKLMLDSFVTGKLTRSAADGLIVPRDAALPDEDGNYAIFTVKDHHAVRHAVKIGLQQDHDVQVIAAPSDDLKAGDAVVVIGNSMLNDGMEVKAGEAPPNEGNAGNATPAAATTAPAASAEKAVEGDK